MSPFSRLAFAYRQAATWQQLAVLAVPLVIFALAEMPWVLAGMVIVLALLFYLRLDLGLALIALYIPSAFAFKHIGVEIVSPLEMLTLACFAAWLAQHVTVGRIRGFSRFLRQRARPPRSSIPARPSILSKIRETLSPRISSLCSVDWAVLCFVAVAYVSLLAAEDKGAAGWELRILIVEPALLYLMIRSGLPDGARLLRLVDGLTAGAVIISLVGLYQYFLTDYVEAVQGVRRILSIYDSPNHVSLFLGRVVPVSLCLAAFGETRWRRIYNALALIPLLLCLYLTYSRGAWLLGLPAALLFIAVMRGRQGRIMALAALSLALLALVPILSTPRLTTLLSLQSGTNFLRIVLWQGTARLIAAHPLTGVGLGNFVSQYPRYMLPEGGHEPVVYHPHNLLLDTWTALGIPGLAVLAWVLTAFFRLGFNLYRRLADSPELQALVLGLMASMISFLAHGLVETGFRLTDLSFVFMLSLGILARLGANARQADPTPA